MVAYTEEDILGALDDMQGGDCWEWPDFQNLSYDIMASRIVAYRDDERWAIVFCVAEWSADDALTAHAMPMGNCVQIPFPANYEERKAYEARREHERRQVKPPLLQRAMWSVLGLDKHLPPQPDFEQLIHDRVMSAAGLGAREIDTIRFEFDYDDESLAHRGYVSAVRIRGKEIDLGSLDFKSTEEGNDAFDLGVAVLDKYRNEIMPTDAELARYFPQSMPPRFLVVEEWNHSKWGLPSEREVFQHLARAMVAGDPALFRPTEEPNTDWRNWIEK